MIISPAAHQEIDGWRTQAGVFDDIFLVFLLLGTLVGAVVVGYLIWNAYKYRAGATPAEEFDAPTLGELPRGGKGGKKLFLSFAISAIVVIALVGWAYTLLLFVEQGAAEDVEPEFEVTINAQQFSWQFEYPNGHTEWERMYIPENTMIELTAESRDVWHTFGVSELRIKMDAIPGQQAESWLLVEETGEYRVECFELCGAGHSAMDGEVIVLSEEEFEDWYEGTEEE